MNPNMNSDSNRSDYVNEWATCEHEAMAANHSNQSGTHFIEQDLANHLMSKTDLHFDSLVVRRVSDTTVLLEGVIREIPTDFDLNEYVKMALGVDHVVNRVTLRPACAAGEETMTSNEDTVVD